MHISSLFLTNFRNYPRFTVEFDKRGNVFSGKNGIGKTNLLEAICYLAYGKSFQAPTDLDLIQHNKEYFRIKGVFVHNNTTHTFEAALDRKKRKFIKIDERKIDKISELYQLLKIVFFSQEDINLIDGVPKYRRHFFDLAISQFDYQYIDLMKRYNQIIRQRNVLLKSNFNWKEKQIWDKQFIETAAVVIKSRIKYLKSINEELENPERRYNDERLKIDYRFSFQYTTNEPLESILMNELKRKEQEEIRYQRTLLGPHLEDYLFLLNQRNISRFGSHGQKRSLVILLSLAQSRLLTKRDNDAAIMIFDDVLSDLDETRATAIISSLNSDNQIFIASPNPEPYKELNLPLIDLEEYQRTNQKTNKDESSPSPN